VKVPEVTGDERAWAPMVRQTRDRSFAPEPDDEVLVAPVGSSANHERFLNSTLILAAEVR